MFSVDALTTPAGAVAPATLADRLGVDASDPMLPGLILAATVAASRYLRRAITPTQYRLNLQTWPVIGAASNWISGHRAQLAAAIELDFTGPLVSVDSVTDGDGQAVTDYQVTPGNPARLSMAAPREPLTITYTAGWSVPPADIVEAVLMAAAYMFEHRGQCDTGSVIVDSGAAWLLSSYRVEL